MISGILALIMWAAPPADPAAHISALEKNLRENILAFWYPRCLDRAHGGYTVNFGPRGEGKGPGTKGIVTQARTLWFFARMARAGYGRRTEMLDAAETGYRFLRDKLWDAANGGFYWEVDAAGGKKLRSLNSSKARRTTPGTGAISSFSAPIGRPRPRTTRPTWEGSRD